MGRLRITVEQNIPAGHPWGAYPELPQYLLIVVTEKHQAEMDALVAGL